MVHDGLQLTYYTQFALRKNFVNHKKSLSLDYQLELAWVWTIFHLESTRLHQVLKGWFWQVLYRSKINDIVFDWEFTTYGAFTWGIYPKKMTIHVWAPPLLVEVRGFIPFKDCFFDPPFQTTWVPCLKSGHLLGWKYALSLAGGQTQLSWYSLSCVGQTCLWEVGKFHQYSWLHNPDLGTLLCKSSHTFSLWGLGP